MFDVMPEVMSAETALIKWSEVFFLLSILCPPEKPLLEQHLQRRRTVKQVGGVE